MTISLSTASARTFIANRDPLSTDYEVTIGSDTIPMEVGNNWLNDSTSEKFECIEVITGVSATFKNIPGIETGTFTPEIQFGGGSTGITYANQSGYYVRVGNAVTINVFVALSSKGTDTGSATLINLPYANGDAHSAFIIYTDNINLSLTYTDFGTRVAPTQQFARLFESGPLLSIQNLTDAFFQNNSQLFISGTYFTS